MEAGSTHLILKRNQICSFSILELGTFHVDGLQTYRTETTTKPPELVAPPMANCITPESKAQGI